MTNQTIRRDLDAATGYQEVLVPALMQEWAPRVADAAGISPGDRVLDVACGTGVLTREAARRAGPGGAVTGLDLSPEMLAVAARLSPELRWQQGSADALPFPDQSFDAVVSQFGLMFFPDPVAGLREMMRVLVPGGRLAVAVWGSLDVTPAYAAEVELLERLAGRAAAGCHAGALCVGVPGADGRALRRGWNHRSTRRHAAGTRAISQHPNDGRGGRTRLASDRGYHPGRRADRDGSPGIGDCVAAVRHGR